MATVPVALVESLLWEDESSTLEFKEKQYPFSGATEDQKSEIVKDILAFANAFRRDEAYVLLGVRDVPGGRGIVTGVTSHLNDADLQQLVNSKTNRVVEFHYHAVTVDSQQVGVIRIPRQKKPSYLLKPYGKLAAQTVYIRHSSSTAIATLEEIARMGADEHSPLAAIPTLELQFADQSARVRSGTDASLTSLVLHLPGKIPDYEDPQDRNPYGFSMSLSNHSYYREVAKHTEFVNLVQPLGFSVENTSGATADDVRLEINISDPGERLVCFDEGDVPSEPDTMPYSHRIIPTIFEREKRDVDVRKTGDSWLVHARFGKIQPKAIHYLRNRLYIGAYENVALTLDALLYADNIPEPQHTPLKVAIASSERAVTLQDLLQLHSQWYLNTPKAKALMKEMEDEKRRP